MIEQSERIAALAEYGEYLRFCVAHPKLANGQEQVDKNIWTMGDKQDSRYLWFVAYSLYVFQRVHSSSDGRGYRISIQSMLSNHKSVLKTCWKEYWKIEHSKAFVQLVEDVIGGADA